MHCDRCGTKTLSTIMSRFNTDALCDRCEAEEQRHPDYHKAVAVEAAALLAGDSNYPGIGWPPETDTDPGPTQKEPA